MLSIHFLKTFYTVACYSACRSVMLLEVRNPRVWSPTTDGACATIIELWFRSCTPCRWLMVSQSCRQLHNLINAFIVRNIKIIPLRNIFAQEAARCQRYVRNDASLPLARRPTYRPPTKCLPLRNFTKGLGAVRLINAEG